MTTDFVVDSFDPLHVGDRVLSIIPMFGCAAAHFINERLQLISVSAYTCCQNTRGEHNTKLLTLSTQDSRNASPYASAIVLPLAPSSQP